MHATEDTQTIIATARHEAAHTVVGWLIGFMPEYAHVKSATDGTVHQLPDEVARPMYNSESRPIALLRREETDEFDPVEDHATPQTVLHHDDIRAVADLMAIMLAGFATLKEDPLWTYATWMDDPGSDIYKIEILMRHYPETVIIRNRLVTWMPEFLSTYVADEVEIVAQALISTTDEPKGLYLDKDELERIRAGLDERRFAEASRVLNAQLKALAFLAADAAERRQQEPPPYRRPIVTLPNFIGMQYCGHAIRRPNTRA